MAIALLPLFFTGCEDSDGGDISLDKMVGLYELIDITIIKASGEVQDANVLSLDGGYLNVRDDSTYSETRNISGSTEFESGSISFVGGSSVELTDASSGQLIAATATKSRDTLTITKYPSGGEVHTMTWRAL
ncbi:hypothetical protein BVX97_03315 [bacterium E08(2017)]|nr:hypothetical protein BVX97_03315 [bacterium E08(2017)]